MMMSAHIQHQLFSKQGARNVFNCSNQGFHLNPALQDLISHLKLINTYFGSLILNIIFFIYKLRNGP